MRRVFILAFAGFLAATLMVVSVSFAGTTEIVSRDSAGNRGDGSSYMPAITADGRYVAFESEATNLVPGDTNGVKDVFVHDRQTGKTEIVSKDSIGTLANGISDFPSISDDGRYVAFESRADNLVPGDTNGKSDVFVHDRQTGTTEIVSVNNAGNPANNSSNWPAISAEGRYVAFESNASNLLRGMNYIFVHDRQMGTTKIVSVDSDGNLANGSSSIPSISADGRYVAFRSRASNLVPDDTNGKADIFVHDRQTGATEVVSKDSAGSLANNRSDWPTISSDGRYVVFRSHATNLVPGDTNKMTDIFVHDRQAGATEIVSTDSAGIQGDGASFIPAISADGRYVAFESAASNLVPDDTNGIKDIFVHDRQTGATEIVSKDSDGTPANKSNYDPAISADGRYVAFESEAGNLVPDDTNGESDIFVRDRN